MTPKDGFTKINTKVRPTDRYEIWMWIVIQQSFARLQVIIWPTKYNSRSDDFLQSGTRYDDVSRFNVVPESLQV